MPTYTFPVRGLHEGKRSGQQPAGTSRDLNNVRPYYDGRDCGGQRPGNDKMFAQRIGGSANYPVIKLLSVTTVD